MFPILCGTAPAERKSTGCCIRSPATCGRASLQRWCILLSAYLLDCATDAGFDTTSKTQMGPSASGKSTLLDVLAGRKKGGRTQGSILFAGNVPTSAFLRRYTGFVEQFGAFSSSPFVFQAFDIS